MPVKEVMVQSLGDAMPMKEIKVRSLGDAMPVKEIKVQSLGEAMPVKEIKAQLPVFSSQDIRLKQASSSSDKFPTVQQRANQLKVINFVIFSVTVVNKLSILDTWIAWLQFHFKNKKVQV